jgi:ACT domain-containing protein
MAVAINNIVHNNAPLIAFYVNKFIIPYFFQKCFIFYIFYDTIFLNKNKIIKRRLFMRGVITVIGKDTVGILAKVSAICADYNANVLEVTQSVLQEMFAMIMFVDISSLNDEFSALSDRLTALGEEIGLSVHTMHEDIFNSMHRI